MKENGFPKLKQFRLEKKMSQKEFANSIGINLSTYNNYETGAREPSSDFWIAISQKYSVSIDFLLGLSKNNSPAPASTGTGELTEIERQLLNNLRSLNDEGQERLINYSEDLVSSGRYIKNNQSEVCKNA